MVDPNESKPQQTPWTRTCSCGTDYIPQHPNDGLCPQCTRAQQLRNLLTTAQDAYPELLR